MLLYDDLEGMSGQKTSWGALWKGFRGIKEARQQTVESKRLLGSMFGSVVQPRITTTLRIDDRTESRILFLHLCLFHPFILNLKQIFGLGKNLW